MGLMRSPKDASGQYPELFGWVTARARGGRRRRRRRRGTCMERVKTQASTNPTDGQ